MSLTRHEPGYEGVIEAAESEWFRRAFRPYCLWLFRRRFAGVYLHKGYQPGSLDRTVWYMNHHTWWDALIPFLLNEQVFGQRVRAAMDEVQLRRHPFFRKLGAFSVNRAHPRLALNSLHYAAESMKRDKAGLYLFPQGRIEAEFRDPIRFEKGLAWLYLALPDVDFVPVATTMNARYSDKPRLFIAVGQPLRSAASDRAALTAQFEHALAEQLLRVREAAEEEFPDGHRLR